MLVRELCCVLAVLLPLAAGAPKKKSEDRIAGLYVKDGDSGQLRFLTPTGSGNAASLNQLITQKQNILEALRPTTAAAGGVTPIIVNLSGNGGGTAVTSPTLTTSPVTGTGTGGGGGGGGGGNGGVLAAAAVGASPVADLLPQIVAQGALGGGNLRRRRPGNKRRRVNRRPVKRRRRRRPSKRSQGNAQVFVMRPRQTREE